MNKDSHGRQYISHSKIVGYWKDKCVTADGDVKSLTDASVDDEEVIIDCGEPECWGCRKQILKVHDLKTYEQTILKDACKIWDAAIVRESLQRCHIVPHALNGDDKDPSNYFLLCESCHKESPDTANPKNFLRWFYRKRKGTWLNGWNMTKLMAEIQAECERQGKDPGTFCIDDMPQGIAQGNHISESTFVYGFVDACKGDT